MIDISRWKLCGSFFAGAEVVLFLAFMAILPVHGMAPETGITLKIGEGGGVTIPSDFVGLSFETANLRPDHNGKYLFDPENRKLIALFRTIGVKNLRIGGGTVDMKSYPDPTTAEIDRFFAFAQSADLKVIYSFRLLNGDPSNAASTAGYIWKRYGSLVKAFAIGNEPDWKSYHQQDPEITDYPTYLSRWRQFAAAVTTAAPGAKLAGPDTGSNFPEPGARSTDFNGESWTRRFAADEKDSRMVAMIVQHDYVGEGIEGLDIERAIDSALSPEWPTVNYSTLYQNVMAYVSSKGLPWRMTECNDHTGGVNGESNAFASALWALDYMHWWASHGCAGASFHNKRWIYTDTIYCDTNGIYRLNPKAYGLKMFNLGGPGHVVPSVLTNPDQLNVTAYAVGNGRCLFVTLINKEHGPTGRPAAVEIKLPRPVAQAQAMYLMAPDADPKAKLGMALGGSAISDDGQWDGRWTRVAMKDPEVCKTTISPVSAALIKITLD